MAAAYVWRGLVLLIGLGVLGYLLGYLAVVVVSVAVATAGSAAQANQSTLLSGALSTVTSGLTALALTIFTLVFFLHDGKRIWRFLVRAVPAQTRECSSGPSSPSPGRSTPV